MASVTFEDINAEEAEALSEWLTAAASVDGLKRLPTAREFEAASVVISEVAHALGRVRQWLDEQGAENVPVDPANGLSMVSYLDAIEAAAEGIGRDSARIGADIAYSHIAQPALAGRSGTSRWPASLSSRS